VPSLARTRHRARAVIGPALVIGSAVPSLARTRHRAAPLSAPRSSSPRAVADATSLDFKLT
jgi:hypothetical protein